MSAGPSSSRELDLVVLGATGFTGRLVVEYLAHAAPTLKVAVAGRSLPRLSEVLTRARAPTHWLTVEIDVGDAPGLHALAKRARVLATTVGPYVRHGLPVVEACATQGTDCVDLTGEIPFVREAADRFDALARSTGARIVNSCGFDAVPSDLGMWLLAKALGPMSEATFAVVGAKGGASGGTVASMLAITEGLLTDPARRRLLLDPYALSPDRAAEPELGPQRDQLTLAYSSQLGRWTAPSLLGTYNARIVRRSNALMGYPYGRTLIYREVSAPRRAGAMVSVAALVPAAGAAVLLNQTGPGRALLSRILPAPGEGPSEALRRAGYLKARLAGRTAAGAVAEVAIEGQGDPGYQLTALMFSEAALCLVNDREALPARAGVLTPASAMGDALVARLRAAGMRLEVSAPGVDARA